VSSAIGRVSTRQLGLWVLFLSLSVLFTASLVAYLVTRFNNAVWRTPAMPELPSGLFASTAMLVGLSAAMWRAQRDVQANKTESLVRDLWVAQLFGIAFLCGQAFNWAAMAGALREGEPTMYPFTFYMLTGLHAAHVVGGFIPLGIVVARAHRRRYSSSEHEGLRLCRQYWDYLFVVWLVLLTALLLAT
jgi:cytochrome c oxidase subunit III